MARRAQSGLKPLHLVVILLLAVGVLMVMYMLMHRGSDPMGRVTTLNPSEYMESATALSGNVYKLEGTIDDRLDKDWRAADGRLFSVQVSEGGTFVPVLVPAALEANIQRGQRYVFKVRVLETGILEAMELLKV